MFRCVAFFACLLLTCLADAARDERIQVAIEEPANGESYSGISNLRGWAVSPAGMGQYYLEIFIDGEFAFNLVPYGKRVDVGNAFPDYPNSDTGGFSMAYNYKNLTPGEHEIKVVAYDDAGNHNSASSIFRTERFNSAFIAQDADINLGSTNNIYLYDDQTFLVRGATLEGQQWDFILSWDRASQSFKTEGIAPATGNAYTYEKGSTSSGSGAEGSGSPSDSLAGSATDLLGAFNPDAALVTGVSTCDKGADVNSDLEKRDRWSALASLMQDEVRERKESDDTLMWGRTVIDLDGDRDCDVLQWFSENFVWSDEFGFLYDKGPLTIYRNHGQAGFSQEKTSIYMTQSSSAFEVVDLNGDGLEDYLTFAGHERKVVNGEETTKSRPTLLLQQENGSLIDASENIEEIYGQWHGSEVLDLDRDGDIDFVTSSLNDNYYIFLNDGSGNFTVEQDLFPVEELNAFYTSPFILEIAAVDVNDNGSREILLGGINVSGRYKGGVPSVPVLEFAGESYKLSDFLDLNFGPVVGEGEGPSGIQQIGALDINRNGCSDLAVYNAASTSSGYALRIWENDCLGNLSLVYEDIYFPNNGGESHTVLKITDLNDDGYLDAYLIKDAPKAAEPLIGVLNNGDGTVTKLESMDGRDIDLDTFLYLNGS